MAFLPRGLTPLIGVFDMPNALRFYRDLLGFEVVSASPEAKTSEGTFSHWVWLKLGAAEIMPIHSSTQMSVLIIKTRCA